MLADLLPTLRKGFSDQLVYWSHTYLPFNRWRKATGEVAAEVLEDAAKYGIRDARVDRRRAYQVARMVVPNRRGDHLVDLLPDAYGVYSPTCCATSHSGKKKILPPAERRQQFRRHAQTLGYVLTPVSLARLGLGGSAPGTIMGIPMDEAAPPESAIADMLQEQLGSAKGGAALGQLAVLAAKLHAGPPQQEEEPAAA